MRIAPPPVAVATTSQPASPVAFRLFLVLNAIMFIRPAELVPQ
jgi:hypothetical protein